MTGVTIGVTLDLGLYEKEARKPHVIISNPDCYISSEEIPTVHHKEPFKVNHIDTLQWRGFEKNI
jgi:hypothetical protein